MHAQLHIGTSSQQSPKQLTPILSMCGWAGAFTAGMEQGKDIFCFFDNDQQAYAVHNVVRLADMLQQGEPT